MLWMQQSWLCQAKVQVKLISWSWRKPDQHRNRATLTVVSPDRCTNQVRSAEFNWLQPVSQSNVSPSGALNSACHKQTPAAVFFWYSGCPWMTSGPPWQLLLLSVCVCVFKDLHSCSVLYTQSIYHLLYTNSTCSIQYDTRILCVCVCAFVYVQQCLNCISFWILFDKTVINCSLCLFPQAVHSLWTWN